GPDHFRVGPALAAGVAGFADGADGRAAFSFPSLASFSFGRATTVAGAKNGRASFRRPPTRLTTTGSVLVSEIFFVCLVSSGVPSWVMISSVASVTGWSGSLKIESTRILYAPSKASGQT